MTEDESKRIDRIKGLLIILVVAGHFGQTIANTLQARWLLPAQATILLIYTFHMPAFLFLSGYLTKDVERSRSRSVGSLLLPYFTYQLIVGIALLVLRGTTEVFQNILVPQFGAWYLLTLFSYRYFLPDLLRVKHPLLLAACLSILSNMVTGIGDELSLKRSMGFLPYFLIGYIARQTGRKLETQAKVKRHPLICLTLIWVLMTVVCAKGQYNNAFSALTYRLYPQNYKEMQLSLLLDITLLIVGLTQIYTIIQLSDYLPEWIEDIGRDTLPLYLSHLVVFMGVSMMTNRAEASLARLICIVATIGSVVVFSSIKYRHWFNRLMNTIRHVVLKYD